MNFSNVVRHALVDQDMKPTDLARMIGKSPQYVHDLLKGNRRWNEQNINKVCEVLGLEINIKKKDTA